MPASRLQFSVKPGIMSKSMPSRKQLSNSLRAEAKLVEELVTIISGGVPNPEESMRWLHMGLDRIIGILPSEREGLERAREAIGVLGAMAAKIDSIKKLLTLAELAAVRLIPAYSTNSGTPSSKGIGPKGKKPNDGKPEGRKAGSLEAKMAIRGAL